MVSAAFASRAPSQFIPLSGYGTYLRTQEPMPNVQDGCGGEDDRNAIYPNSLEKKDGIWIKSGGAAAFCRCNQSRTPNPTVLGQGVSHGGRDLPTYHLPVLLFSCHPCYGRLVFVSANSACGSCPEQAIEKCTQSSHIRPMHTLFFFFSSVLFFSSSCPPSIIAYRRPATGPG